MGEDVLELIRNQVEAGRLVIWSSSTTPMRRPVARAAVSPVAARPNKANTMTISRRLTPLSESRILCIIDLCVTTPPTGIGPPDYLRRTNSTIGIVAAFLV